jgi:DNA anti-recombination protein RmuC
MPKKKIEPTHKETQKSDTEPKMEPLDEKRSLRDTADDIIASYEARVRVVGGIIEDTHKMMSEFKDRREHMSKELQEVLAKRESLRKKDFDRMMADIVARQNEREKEVKEMLENFRKEEEAVAEKLRNLLRKGEEIRIKDFKKMMLNIKQEQEKKAQETSVSVAEQLQKMQGEVHTMLDNFKKERQSVASAWHEALSLFHKEKSRDK